MDDCLADRRAGRHRTEGGCASTVFLLTLQTYDPTETRVLVTSAPVTRTGLLSLLTLGVKADLTISGGLHCEWSPSTAIADHSVRYPASLNDFAVSGDFDAYRQKLVQARDSFIGVYDVVKERVEGVLK